MDDRNSGTNQGGQGQPRTSRPGSNPPGKDVERERGNPESDKPSTRPTPSGVPNEGRSAEGQGRKVDQTQGGVPNPDDADDDESAGTARTAAEIETDAQLDSASNAEPDDETVGDADGADVDDEEEESNEASEVTGQSHNDELNRQPRNPE